MKTITVRDLRQRWPRAEAMLERERSEEHTSELQSPCNLVCRLLLEKKKVYVNRLVIDYFNLCLQNRHMARLLHYSGKRNCDEHLAVAALAHMPLLVAT